MPRKGSASGSPSPCSRQSRIAPRWPLEQALHSSLTVLAWRGLWWHDRRWPLQPLHFALVCAFIVAHCVGARWLYSLRSLRCPAAGQPGWSPTESLRLATQPLRPPDPLRLRFLPCAAGMALAGQRWRDAMTQAGAPRGDAGDVQQLVYEAGMAGRIDALARAAEGLQRPAGRHVGCACGHAAFATIGAILAAADASRTSAGKDT